MVEAMDSPTTVGSRSSSSGRSSPANPSFSSHDYPCPSTESIIGMDYGLDEELIAIESIYGPKIIAQDGQDYHLHVPNTAGVVLHLQFPSDYPASCPDVDKVVSAGSSTAHGWGQHVLETVRAMLNSLWVSGEPVLHPLIEELQGAIFSESVANANEHDGSKENEPITKADKQTYAEPAPFVSSLQRKPEWFISDIVAEKKSTFISHATRIDHPAEAPALIEALVSSDKKFEKATHNMSAYRGRFVPDGADRELVFQDCDDDGEDAAGGRLLHLLELTGASNVLVVVSRWYGGVKLGPDRFRIINQVARDALVVGGFVKEGHKGAKKGR